MAFMSKEDIKVLQELLNIQGADLEVDGFKGPLTNGAIDAFRRGLLKPKNPPEEPEQGGDNTEPDTVVEIKPYEYVRNVKYGETSDYVKKLQAMLVYQSEEFRKYLGTAGIDGVYGYGTRKAIEQFMRGHGLNEPIYENSKYKKKPEYQYKTVDRYIWELLMQEPVDISKWTDDRFRCNCCGKLPPGFGVAVSVKILTARIEIATKKKWGDEYYLGFTDDIDPENETDRNGGYRCPDWNEKCHGAEHSRHKSGDAIDTAIFKDGKHQKEDEFDYVAYQQLSNAMNPFGGNSLHYKENDHHDTRGYGVTW